MKLCEWKFRINCPDNWTEEKIESMLAKLETIEEKITGAIVSSVEELDPNLTVDDPG